MRLLTAIPLLFWASTAAMAQLAVLWATEPAAAVTHATSQDASLEAGGQHELSAEFAAVPFAAIGIVPDYPAPKVTFALRRPVFGVTLQARILAASRLLANPPPVGV